MRRLFKPLILLAIVLAIPIVPFVLLGELDPDVRTWFDADASPGRLQQWVVAVLAVDIFLPIPSSAVSTFAGYQFGAWRGMMISWLGMTLGATVGFALARLLGWPFARWLSDPAELVRMHALGNRLGPLVLVLARAVPVMAEASVLLMGALRLSWWRFLPAVMASNLGIAVAYSVLGEVAGKYQAIPFALAISVLIPVLMALAVNRWIFPKHDATLGD